MNRKIKASHTLEASIVVTIVMFVIISLMYLTFYMHDRVILKLCAYSSAIDGVFENKEYYKAADDNVQKLNMLTVLTSGVSVQNKTVTYKGSLHIPFSIVSMFWGDEEIKENGNACEKMNIQKMYVVEIVGDKLIDKEGNK